MANVLRHLAPLVWLTVASVVLTNVRAVHWDHAAQLTDDFRLLWNIKRSDITFEMQVRTHGYVGLGFARSADRRAGADVIVGWVDDAGQTFAQVNMVVVVVGCVCVCAVGWYVNAVVVCW